MAYFFFAAISPISEPSAPSLATSPTATPPFSTPPVVTTNNTSPVYYRALSPPLLSIPLPSSSSNTSPENIVCPDCVVQAVEVASSVLAGKLEQRITCNHERYVNGTVSPSSPINLLKNTMNAMTDLLKRLADECMYVAHETAVKGKLGVQARCDREMKGIWRDFVVNLNTMTRSHLEQVRDIADVSTAIARGDLSKAMTVPVKGETLVLKNTFNTMVNQLNLFASEVSRVAHDVGTEGRLGAQATVAGADGIWKELTDNVNTMAANLTNQVRDIAQVSKSVARGDLTKKVTVEVKGEMLDLKNTINTMVDQVTNNSASLCCATSELNFNFQHQCLPMAHCLAFYICDRSHSCLVGSWNRRNSRRPSCCQGCSRHVEGPY